MQSDSGYNWTATSGGTAASTAVIKNMKTVLGKIVIPGTYVGTVAFYDSSTAAGTADGNTILTVGLPTTSIPQSLDLGIQCKNGLTVTSDGTPTLTIGWR